MHLDQNNVEHTKPSSEQLHGLTDAEVRQRIEQGLVNHNSDIKKYQANCTGKFDNPL